MVKLRNIKKNNGLIECDIYPEDCKLNGHIVVDITSKELKEFSLPEGYEWCRNHVTHAKSQLVNLVSKNTFLNEYTVMWC